MVKASQKVISLGDKAGAGKSRVSFSQGVTLHRIAGEYSTVLAAILEGCQNSFDENATQVTVRVDLQGFGFAVIEDNGSGVSPKKFDEALATVCVSKKDPTKMGRFGIGLISPLGKCREFTFTSRCPDTKAYTKWTFNSTDIMVQKEAIFVPNEELPNTRFLEERLRHKGRPKDVELVPWITQVYMRDLTEDRTIAHLDPTQLERSILDRYGASMRASSAVVTIDFTGRDGKRVVKCFRAKDFEGEPMPELIIQSPEAGRVIFRLFKSPRGKKGRNGRVLFGELQNPFRIGLGSFRYHSGGTLDDEIVKALVGGCLEGEILAEKIHINVARTGFMVNDALIGLFVAIEEWYHCVGKECVQSIRESMEDVRYQDLGRRSLLNLRKFFLKNEQLGWLLDDLARKATGNVGEGHTKPDPKNEIGLQSEKVLAPVFSKKDPGGQKDDDPNAESRGKRGELAKHKPLTTVGPNGRQRTRVADGSVGLCFSHVERLENGRLFYLDVSTVTLYFDIRHPAWVAVEHSDRKIMQLQEFCVILALGLEAQPEGARVTQQLYVDYVVPLLAGYLSTLGVGETGSGDCVK